MLTFNKTQANLIISGKTFYVRDRIKALGGIWDSIGRSWVLPAHLDSESLRVGLLVKATMLEKAEKKEAADKRAYAESPEGKAAAAEAEKAKILLALEQKKKDGSYHWICCEECKVLDWNRRMTSCKPHGADYGLWTESIRINGKLYTGD